MALGWAGGGSEGEGGWGKHYCDADQIRDVANVATQPVRCSQLLLTGLQISPELRPAGQVVAGQSLRRELCAGLCAAPATVAILPRPAQHCTARYADIIFHFLRLHLSKLCHLLAP